VKKSLFRVILGTAVTLVFLWLFFRQIEFSALFDGFARVSIPSVILAMVFLTLGYSLRVIRWWMLLSRFEPSLKIRACAWPLLASVAVNNLLPFRAGDVVRIVGFRSKLKSPAMRILGTLVIERLFDLLTLLVFFFAGLAGISAGILPPALLQGVIYLTAILLIAIVIFLLFVERLRQWAVKLVNSSVVSREQLKQRLSIWLDHVFSTLILLRSWRLVGKLTLISLLIWSFEGAVFTCVALGLAGDISFSGYFAMATGTLATLLPSSPGYFGTFDFFALLGYQAYGVQPASGAVMTMVVHFILWGPLTLLGISYYMRPGLKSIRQRGMDAV